MGHAGGGVVEPIHRQKGGLMFETAADNSSILSIDLGLLLGLLVLSRLLDPSLVRQGLEMLLARPWLGEPFQTLFRQTALIRDADAADV